MNSSMKLEPNAVNDEKFCIHSGVTTDSCRTWLGALAWKFSFFEGYKTGENGYKVGDTG
jgi:hypothetical protein